MSKHSRLKSERDRLELFKRFTEEALADNPSLTRSEAEVFAAKQMPEAHRANPHYEAAFLETAPSSLAVPRKFVNSAVEIKAMFKEPTLAWLFHYLQQGKRGRPAARALIAAILFHMANFGRPDAINSRRHFTGTSANDWAYDFPKGPHSDSAYYDSIKQMAYSHLPGATIHVNLDLLDRMASLVDPETGQLRHPDAFRRCAVDGTLIEADLPQNPVGGRSQRDRKRKVRFAAGPERQMADFVVHGFETGSEPTDGGKGSGGIRKSVFGYNLVVIACMDLGLPVIWMLIPAATPERNALHRMLECLYELRPNFPMEYLVGDGHYSMPFDLTGELYFKYGIHGCFPVLNKPSDNKWAETNGIPECKHGLMKFEKEGEVWGSAKRRKYGMAPGVYPKQTRPRFRWKCRNGKCRSVETIMPNDWNLNTYLHHGGGHKRAAMRAALTTRRNIIESLFSQLKHSGPGSKWPGRARWANDDGMRWLTSLALLTMTAKRLAHESGAYAEAFEEARELGYLAERERMKVPGVKRSGVALMDPPSGMAEPEAPSTWDGEYLTPDDEEFIPKDIDLYSDKPDRDEFARDVPPV